MEEGSIPSSFSIFLVEARGVALLYGIILSGVSDITVLKRMIAMRR